MNDVKTREERERKSRWRRGVQRSWKDDSDLASVEDFGDESTYADTYHTGADSYTDDTESSSYDSWSCQSSRFSSQLGKCSGRKYQNSGRRRSRSLSNNGQSVFGAVAEDLGVVASMLLSDGSACFSSAAEITHETIASCRTTHH